MLNKRAMISQPMAGKTDEEIAEARDKAHAKLREMGYEFVNTLFTDEWYSDGAMEERGVVQVPLCYLAKSLENMSLCHAAYFCKHAVHEGEHNAFRPLRCALRFGQLRNRCVAKTCRPHRPPEREYRASSVSWSPALDKVLPWRASFRGYANGV